MRFRDLHPNIKIRMVVQFLGGLAMMMVMPYLAIYFAEKIGETMTGIMFLVVIIAGICGGIIGGYYSDRIGRRKLMIVSELVVLGTFVLIALVNSPWLESPYLTFGLFVVNVFFGGLFGPAAQAMIIDVSTSESRKYIFGISYWAGNLANMLGGIVGAFLFKSYRFELYLAVCVVTLVSLLTTIFFIKETYVPQKNEESNEGIEVKPKEKKSILHIFSSYGTVLKDKIFIIYIVVSLLILALENQLSNYIGIRLEKEMSTQSFLPSWSPISFDVDGIRMLGLLRAENTFLVVVGALLVTRIMKRFPDKWVMLIGIFLFTIGFSVVGVSNAPWILLLAMFVLTVGELMWVPIKQAYLGDIAPANARSSYMAINGLTGSGAMMIGALFITLGGWVSSWVMGVLFLIMGLSSIIMLYRILPDLHHRRVKQETPTTQQTVTSI